MYVLPLNVLKAAAAAAILFGFASFAAAQSPCQDGVIRLGAISTITGPADLSDVPLASKAVFDDLNAAGGIKGCKIEYSIADDKADPAVAAQVARDLIDNQEIVGLVGSASLLDCAVNAQFYKRRQISSVHGLGADAACFNSSTIAPVNAGQYTMMTIMGRFAVEELKSKAVCAMFVVIGGTKEAFNQSVEEFESLTGTKMRLVDFTLPPQGDLTPFLIKVREAGCDAVITNESEPGMIQWMKTVEDQKMTGINWLFFATAYTDRAAQVLAKTKQPVYAGAEWEPFTDSNSAANSVWRDTMKRANRPLNGLSQGGVMAAQILVDVIKGINGPITRETVTQALEEMAPNNNPLGGNPYQFGKKPKHAPMRSAKVVQLRDGAWSVVTNQWLSLSPLN
jgi:branched-chain amino acid transport system substrate-binding protein